MDVIQLFVLAGTAVALLIIYIGFSWVSGHSKPSKKNNR
ncbi:hypothetical protein ALT1000_360045 [Alteromonas macleodii]